MGSNSATPNRPHLWSSRALAVAALGLVVCASVGCQSASSPQTWFTDMVDSFNPPTPQEAARDAFNVYDADKRRRAVALISASPFGGEKAYLDTYRMLISDPDPTVRAACAKALGMHGHVDDVDHLLPLLDDEQSFVRWEAAKALQRLHDTDAIGPLLEVVKSDNDADVRMAAAKALGQYPQPRVFDVLLGALNDRDFGVVDAAHQSLVSLTGKDELPADSRDWLAWSRDHRTELFTNRQTYTYQPYEAPPGIMDKVRFWSEPERISPRAPAGLEEARANDTATSG